MKTISDVLIGEGLINHYAEDVRRMTQDNEGWIEWSGGECPVDGHHAVEIKSRGGQIDLAHAYLYNWFHTGNDHDIIAYRLPKIVINPDYVPLPLTENKPDNKQFYLDAWVKMYCSIYREDNYSYQDAARVADGMLEELKKRVEEGRL